MRPYSHGTEGLAEEVIVELPVVSAIPLNPGYRSRLVFTSARHAIGLLVSHPERASLTYKLFSYFFLKALIFLKALN